MNSNINMREKFSKTKKFALFIGGLILLIMFSGCAALGTKTLHRSNNLNLYNFEKLGFSQPAKEKELNKIRPKTSEIYQSTVETFFIDKTIEIEKYNLPDFELFDDISTTDIINICEENMLDGYLCTQIKYRFVNNYYMYIPLGKSEDAYVEMKLYDNKGTLLLHTKHDTYAGNSYMMPPKAEQTIRDGTLGALKQIIKEINRFNN